MSNFWGAYQKYYVLTNLSTRTHWNKYVYLLKYLRALTKVFVRTYGFEEPSTLGAKTLGGRKVVSLC